MLKRFFKKKQILPPIPSKDIHSHLLPGIDDGVKSLDESIEIIHLFKELGIYQITTTPHIMGEHYPNTPAIIRSKLRELHARLDEKGISVKIDAAAEYYFDDHFLALIESPSDLLTFDDGYLLVETPVFNPPPNWQEVFFELRTNGITPILAHPERYPYIAGKPEIARQIKDLGVKLQMNIPSLLGFYGEEVRKTALTLKKKGLVDFYATDCHNIKQASLLKEAFKR